MSRQSNASRFALFVMILIAIAGFTALAAQYQMLPGVALHAAHRAKWARGALGATLWGSPSDDRITQAIDEKVLVTLAGNTRPEANSANDLGAVADNFPIEHMHLLLRRSPEQEQELEQLIDELNDRTSPNFHHWLTADEFGQRFGAAQGDIDTITGWLESHGFTVNKVYTSQILIDFSGNAGQVKETFHTQIHQIAVNGQTQIANMSDPQIPAALAPVIKAIASLNNFKPHPMYKSRTQYTFAGCASSAGLPTEPGTCYALTPQDNAVIYNTNPLWNGGISGQGQTIALVEDTDTYTPAGGTFASDWNSYRTAFGLSGYAGTYTELHPGGCTDPGSNGDDGEAAIDVEMASAFAPSANIELISCGSGTFTFGGQIALQNLINGSAPYPGVVSVSYGLCEAFNGAGENAAFYNTYQQAAAQGISVFVSSGDEGPSSCSNLFGTTGEQYDVATLGVTGWGETPYNVSVGGTDFEDVYNSKEGGLPLSNYWSATNSASYGSALQYVPEMPWNDSCASVLISEIATGSFIPYGASPATCNNATFDTSTTYLSTGAASGGASNCATGAGGTDQGGDGDTVSQCQGYAKPSWQSAYGVPSDGLRDIPDVSMFAANGVWGHFETVCWSDPTYSADGSASCAGVPSTWSGFGGTSVAAPSMAAIQSLVNQRTGETWGNPNPMYYEIAQSEYGAQGGSFLGSGCNSSVLGGPASGCVFNDVTQGDIDLACEHNGTLTESQCYLPSSTHGVDSTDVITAATIINGGTGYTSAPTCAIAGPTNSQPYLSPLGGTLWAGGTQASCTAAINAGTTTAAWTVKFSSDALGGTGLTVGGTPYTFVTSLTGAPANSVLTGSSTTNMAKNFEAAINANSAQCAVSPCFGTGTTANASATATESTSTVTMTAKTTGYAGNFNVTWANGFEEGPAEITITNTVLGQGPNYVSGITITAGGSGYQPDTPLTLTGAGTGAIAVANTSVSTGASTYQPAYGAAPGYDLATGLGTVNAYNLVNAFLPQQTITFTTPAPSSAANGSNFSVAATASSGLTVAFTASGVCTVVDNLNGTATYTMTSSTGTCDVIANQAGNSTYAPAPTVTEDVTATSAVQNQTITFTVMAPTSAVYNTNFNVAATASSGLTVAFTASGVCSVVDHLNGMATYTMTSGTGTCTVTANQAGNANYNPAPQVTENTTASLATPTTTFTGAPTSAAYGTQFGVTSSTNASTSATIASSGACSGSGTNSATITMTSGTGTCAMMASWAADNNYAAATANQSTTAQQAAQYLSFTQNAPSGAVYNTSFNVAATASSGLTVAFTASGVCSVVDHLNGTAQYTMTSGTGTCTVIANQAGDGNYNPAQQASQMTTAQLATPTVTFTGAPTSAAYGSSFGVTSSTNSSTAAAITSSGACSGSGTSLATITMTSGTGACSMMAVWAADNNYSGATATQSTSATLAATSTALTSVNYSLNPGQSTTLTATVTFSGSGASPSGNVTFYLNGNALTPVGALSPATATTATATYTLSASQLNAGGNSLYASYAGDPNYSGSDSSASPITINLGSNNLSFGNVNVGSSASGMTVTYNFTANETLSDVHVVTAGTLHKDFSNAGGGTCAANTAYTTGQSCTVNVGFTPAAPGVRSGAVKLYATGMTLPLATFFINGTGESAAVTVDPGTQTSLGSFAGDQPIAVALDGAGNAYVSDAAGNQVMEVAAGTQTQTTVATGFDPRGLAVDGAGNLYISDITNNRVAVIPNEKGTLNAADLYTVGTGLSAPDDVKVDALGDVYIVDSDNNRIVEVAADGTQTAPVTGVAHLTGVAVDAAGDIYVAAQISPGVSGVVNEYPAGGGGPIQIGSGFQYPSFLALDASGTLYVTDSGLAQVVEVTPAGTQTTVPVAGLTTPKGVAVDASGNVYITDYTANALYEVNRTQPLALSFPTEMIGNASPAQTVTVSNVGNQQLTASNLAIPANFLQTSSGGTDCSSSTTLNASVMCQIAIEFDPTGAGSDSGNVTLTDNALNNPASTQSVSVSGNGSQDSQTITFTQNAPSSAVYNTSFGVAATASSGLTVAFTASGQCTVVDNLNGTATYTMTSGTGTCTVLANQPGNGTYAAAPEVTESATAALATPTVTYTGAPMTAAYGSSFNVTAHTNASTQGMTSTTGSCSNVLRKVTMTSGTGTCNMTATWAADQNYTGATASQSTTATLATPTVTFTGAPNSATYGTQFNVTSTTNASTLAAITSSGVCTGSGTVSAEITMASGTGTCSMLATWAADSNYAAATANQSTSASLATPTVTFTGAPNSAAYNSTFTVTATTNDMSGPGRHRPQSENPAAITASGACSVPANSQNSALVTMTSGTGTCSLTATWQADNDYNGATANQSTTASLATPTVTFTGAPNSATYGTQFNVTSTTTASTLAAITSSGVCTGSGTVSAEITMASGTGTCSMLATWAADNNYAAATANQSTSASLANPTVTFTGAPSSAAYNSTFTVTATTNDMSGPGRHRPQSENPAAITASGACSVPANSQNSALVTMTSGTGTCSLTATWQADNDYTGATANQSTTASKIAPTVTFTGAPLSGVYDTSFTVNSTTNSSTLANITVSGACSITSGGTNSATVKMTSGTGACSLAATWAADGNYNSATAMQSTTAAKATTRTAFSTSPNPSTKGQKVTLSATVAGPNGDGVPTGTITFQPVSGAKMKVEPVSPAGGATFSISTLPVGSHKVEAIYSGDSNFAGSTSNVVTQVVNR